MRHIMMGLKRKFCKRKDDDNDDDFIESSKIQEVNDGQDN
jgi:hypothetical protein